MHRLISILLFLAMAMSSMAEVHYKPHIWVGAHGGLDLSKVSFSPSVKQGWADGYTAGISVRYAEERLVGVLAEANISQRGWSEIFDEGSPLRYTRRITYCSMPVMTHVYFGPPRFKCFFNLGFELGYMLGESTDANFDYANPSSSPDWSDDPRMTAQLTMPVKTRFDYGIVGGFGCEFYLTPRHSMYVEGRYYFGLGNIFPVSKADVFGASRNMTVSVTLGYNFRIK